MPTNPRSDATPAYRGYRLQALYTLWRILTSGEEPLIFHPEGKEDMAVFTAEGELLEVIQVKTGRNLSLSSFDPAKPGSFFYRAADQLRSTPAARIRVIAFGSFGPELEHFCGIVDKKSIPLAAKLSEHGLLSIDEACKLFPKIELTVVQEDLLCNEIFTNLQESVTGIDPAAAFDILTAWLYRCAEEKRRLTRRDVLERINSVGRFLSARAAHQQEWFTSIIPVEDKPLEPGEHEHLAEEFYRGVSSRYEHILADLDVLRPRALNELKAKFETNRVVIVHAASGQGKTALALRYLHDFFPEAWRFQIRSVEDSRHALSIAAALTGHADAVGFPIIIFIDASAQDAGWPALVRQLSVQRGLQVLVTVREEDFQRASLSGADIEFASMSLTLNQDEARQIYEALTQKRPSTELLGFEEAWQRFGGQGPLMEFVYLIAQGELLQERLSHQVRRLEDEARATNDGDLTLLRLVSIAAAYEARLEVLPLTRHLRLAAPKRSIELLEQEYLLRRDGNGMLLQGLHPIRSAILAEIMTDPVFMPWSTSAIECLPFLYEQDVETFLLCGFSRHREDTDQLMRALTAYQPASWIAIVGVVRALIWLGVRQYVITNQSLIQETYAKAGNGWWWMLDYDLTDAMGRSDEKWWQQLGDMVSKETREQIQEFIYRQTDKVAIFEPVAHWLKERTVKLSTPVSSQEWAALGETLFWLGRSQVQWPHDEWLPAEVLDKAVSELPISILAKVITGLEATGSDRLIAWRQEKQPDITERFRRETDTLALNTDGQALMAHFLIRYDFPPASQRRPGSDNNQTENGQGEAQNSILPNQDRDPLHTLATERMQLLMHLIPHSSGYASQGYGHRLWSAELPFDSTQKKSEPGRTPPLEYLTAINATFRGLAERFFRPTEWAEYADQILSIRQEGVQSLEQLRAGLAAYFRRSDWFNLFDSSVDSAMWDQCQKQLNRLPLLPQCAVDEWGFLDEASADYTQARTTGQAARVSLALQQYKPYLKSLHNYTRPLTNFFSQAPQVIAVNSALGRVLRPNPLAIKRIAAQQGIGSSVDRLSVLNLTDTLKALPVMQAQFRMLLAHLVPEERLKAIERDERDTLMSLWSLWYIFANHPARRMQYPERESAQPLAEAIRKAARNLRSELRHHSNDRISLQISPRQPKWEDEATLWITADGTDAVELYEAVPHIINVVRHALPVPQNEDARHYAYNFEWSYLGIVLTVRGRCLQPQAWRVFLPMLFAEDELSQWHYMPKVLPCETWANLGISCWDDPRIDKARTLSETVTRLWMYAAHVRDLENLPALDDLGNEQLDQYLDEWFDVAEETLSAAIGHANDLTQYLRIIPVSQKENYPRAGTVSDLLVELRDLLEMEDEPEAASEAAAISHWSYRLERASNVSSVIYLLWATDITSNAAQKT